MNNNDTLERLYNIVLERRKGDPDKSYIAKKLKQGTAKIAQKVGEVQILYPQVKMAKLVERK